MYNFLSLSNNISSFILSNLDGGIYMECAANNEPQLFTNVDNEIETKELDIYMRYPSSQSNERIKGHCLDLCTNQALNFINEIKKYVRPKVEFHHVHLLEASGKSETVSGNPVLGTEDHWEWKGKAKYQIYVTCV